MLFRRPKHTSGGQPLIKVARFQAALRKFVGGRGTGQTIAIYIKCETESISVNVPGMHQVAYGVGPRLHMDRRDLGLVLNFCTRAVGRTYTGRQLKQLTEAVKAARSIKIVRECGQQLGTVHLGDVAPGDQS